MKKFFKVLLLAAVALMPVMGMAQTGNERDYNWERQMRSQEHRDSVEDSRMEAEYAIKRAEYEHEQKMAQIKHEYRSKASKSFFNSGVCQVAIIVGSVIAILVLCLHHSRRKAEDHKELINKLIDKNLLNSTEPISKEAIEALMKPKKSEKERFIGDATLVGLGLGIGFASDKLQGGANEILVFAAYILLFLGALRLVIRTISLIIAYIINKKKEAETDIKEAEPIEEAEAIEEK